MPISATNYDGSTNYSVAEMGDLAKPNLLINSDFRGNVINQRGKTTYSHTSSGKGVYSIDHWRLYDNTKIQVYNGYIRLTKTSTSPYLSLVQPIELDENNLPDKLTYTIRMKASTSLILQVYSTNRIINVGTTMKDYTFTVTKEEYSPAYSDGYLLFYITLKNPTPNDGVYNGNINSGVYVDVEYAKAEIGEHFTGMPKNDVTLEMLKCKRYYRQYNLAEKHFSTNASATNCYIVYDNEVPMYKAPTVNNDLVFDAYFMLGDQYIGAIGITSVVCTDWNDRMIINITANKALKASTLGMIKAPTTTLQLSSEIY